MTNTGSFEDTVLDIAKKNGLEANRIKFSSIAELDIHRIELAICFYHALWSTPSVMIFPRLCYGLSKQLSEMQLIIINADELSDADKEVLKKAALLFGPSIGGYGEACGIKEGEIVWREVIYWKNSESAQHLTRTKQYDKRVIASEPEVDDLIARRIAALS